MPVPSQGHSERAFPNVQREPLVCHFVPVTFSFVLELYRCCPSMHNNCVAVNVMLELKISSLSFYREDDV